MNLLRQARHPLKLWDQAQGDHRPIDVAAPSGRHRLPRVADFKNRQGRDTDEYLGLGIAFRRSRQS